jgi:hypothetical protein
MTKSSFVYERYNILTKKIENIRLEAVDIFNRMVESSPGLFPDKNNLPKADGARELWAIHLLMDITSVNPFTMAIRKSKEECLQEVDTFVSNTFNDTSLKDGLATIYFKQYFILVEMSRKIMDRQKANNVSHLEESSMQYAFRRALGH